MQHESAEKTRASTPECDQLRSPVINSAPSENHTRESHNHGRQIARGISSVHAMSQEELGWNAAEIETGSLAGTVTPAAVVPKG
jgi:hypothetical protein